MRAYLLVSTWNVCCCAFAITVNTQAMNWSGTSLWNKSLIELVKTRRGRFQCKGCSSLSGRSVTSKPFSKWWPGTPRHRSAKVSA